MARHPMERDPLPHSQLMRRVPRSMARRRQRALTDRDAREALLRSLMANVPGAIYRSAWHADYALELISDEIERISGYPASDFLGADARRTIMSIICAEDRDAVLERAAERRRRRAAVQPRVPHRAPRRGAALGPRSRPPRRGARAARSGWTARSSTSPSGAPTRRRCAATRSSARACRSCAHRRRGSSRPPTRRAGASSATCTTARSSTWWRWRSRSAWRARAPSATRTSAVAFLERVGEALAAASAELRELAHGIHPAVLTERGLAAAVQALAGRSTVPVEVLETPADRLAAPIEAAAYFVVAEALTNVAKYAQASAATVKVTVASGRARGRGERRRRRRRHARRGLGPARAVGPRRAPSTGR